MKFGSRPQDNLKLTRIAFRQMEAPSTAGYIEHLAHTNTKKPNPEQIGRVSLIGCVNHFAHSNLTAADDLEALQIIRESNNVWHQHLQVELNLSDTQRAFLKTAGETALHVGVLTEDNVPGYREDIGGIINYTAPNNLKPMYNKALGLWIADESAHALEANKLLIAYGTSHTAEFQDGVTSQHLVGSSEKPVSIIHQKIYTSIQEILAGVAHRKNALLLEPFGAKLLSRIDRQEFQHHKWFASEAKALANSPDKRLSSAFIVALRDVILDFSMPGQNGIPNYFENAKIISGAGILTLQDTVDAIQKCLNTWYPNLVDQNSNALDYTKLALQFEGDSEVQSAILQLEQKLGKLSKLAQRLQPRSDISLSNPDFRARLRQAQSSFLVKIAVSVAR
jgi:Fatty acid desaturase